MHFIRLPVFISWLLAGSHCAVAPGAAAASAPVTQRVSGAFDITLTPATSTDSDGVTTARMRIEKQYHGALSGSGHGEMLTAVSASSGGAAYVAIERVSGTLGGRQGAFALHHTGTRSGGAKQLSIGIVSGSGSGALQGISGTLDINIVDGKHFYVLEFQLP